MPRAPGQKRRRRPPFFHPVPLRARKDGWSEERQCLFLARLYATGSVTGAAQAAGMSRMSAYRLRRCEGAESFARAWDAVLTSPGKGRLPPLDSDRRKVTDAALYRRIETGLIAPAIHRGLMTGIRRKPDNSALLRLIRRLGPA